MATPMHPSHDLPADAQVIGDTNRIHVCNCAGTCTHNQSVSIADATSVSSTYGTVATYEHSPSSSIDTSQATNTSDDSAGKNSSDISDDTKFSPDYHAVKATMNCIFDAMKTQHVSGVC